MFRLYARHIHHNDQPWDGAPHWAVELREMMGLLFIILETKMSKLDDALAALASAQLANHNAVQTEIAALKTLIANGDQAGANAAADKIMGIVATMTSDTNDLATSAASSPGSSDTTQPPAQTSTPPAQTPPATPPAADPAAGGAPAATDPAAPPADGSAPPAQA